MSGHFVSVGKSPGRNLSGSCQAVVRQLSGSCQVQLGLKLSGFGFLEKNSVSQKPYILKLVKTKNNLCKVQVKYSRCFRYTDFWEFQLKFSINPQKSHTSSVLGPNSKPRSVHLRRRISRPYCSCQAVARQLSHSGQAVVRHLSNCQKALWFVI